ASQVALGKMYMAGDGGVPRDRNIAAEWFRKAADSGDAEAKTALAILHLQDDAAVRDSSRAEELLKQAAESGDAAAATQLGHLCSAKASEGRADEALVWYAKAANAGNAEAQYSL